MGEDEDSIFLCEMWTKRYKENLELQALRIKSLLLQSLGINKGVPYTLELKSIHRSWK